MKSLGLLLLATGLLLAFAPSNVVAQAGQTTFDLDTHADGSNYYFTLKGQTDKNPTLTVPASTSITINIHNVGGAAASTHNVCDSYDSKCSDFVSADGDTATLTFTSGTADGDYHCQPHASLGMKGTLHIAGAGGSTSSSSTTSTKASPGFGLVGVAIAIVGAGLLLRRK